MARKSSSQNPETSQCSNRPSLLGDDIQSKFVHQANVSSQPVTELHYFWCQSGHFHFRHYLALYSTVRRFAPHVVHFHAIEQPIEAPATFEWFEDAKNLMSQFEVHLTSDARCTSLGISQVTYLERVVNADFNAVLVQGGAVINDTAMKAHSEAVSSKLTVIATEAVVRQVQTLYNFTTAFLSPAISSSLAKKLVTYITCYSVNVSVLFDSCHGNYQLLNDSCVPRYTDYQNNVTDCVHFASDIFVRDAITSKSSLASFIRQTFCGTPDPIRPASSQCDVIPRIGHFVRVSADAISTNTTISTATANDSALITHISTTNVNKTFVVDFTMYLSILSLLGVVKVQCVYIHGNVRPTVLE